MNDDDERFNGPELIVTEDGSHSLYLSAMKETYHSFHGALQESEHVFIRMGLEYFSVQSHVSPIRILEVGFGTGLNALLSAIWAAEKGRNLFMDSIEAYPLPLDLASQLNYPKRIGKEISQPWFDKLHENPWNKQISIHSSFSLKKVDNKLQEQRLSLETYHIVFFDAFAPNKQSELWEREVLAKVFQSQAPGGVFVTYCAKGQLKRDLKEIGYQVETLPGPPGKKEMVRGTKK